LAFKNKERTRESDDACGEERREGRVSGRGKQRLELLGVESKGLNFWAGKAKA